VLRKIILINILLLFTFSSLQINASSSRVAIIIDDIGYRYTDKQALTLPGAITYSILPHTPYGKKLALKAYAKNQDILLHIPMESEKGRRLGPGALTSEMNEQAIHASLRSSLNEIPFAIGINNHMGSRLTKLRDPMIWTMSFLKSNHLFFLDSKTSPKSKANEIAKSLGVPVRNRHIFLDNELTDTYITQQFNQLIDQAKKYKMAIAIAHPHPETINILQRLIPTLKENNIDLVPLSALYPQKITSHATVLAGE